MQKECSHVRERKRGLPLRESELFELYDHACVGKRRGSQWYDNYGIKNVGGRNRLSGDGVKGGDEPGIMQGAGNGPTDYGQDA